MCLHPYTLHSMHTQATHPVSSQIPALSWPTAYSRLLVAFSRYCNILLLYNLQHGDSALFMTCWSIWVRFDALLQGDPSQSVQHRY